MIEAQMIMERPSMAAVLDDATCEVEDRSIELITQVLCNHVRKEAYDLTMRQAAILVMIARGRAAIGEIARELNVSLSVVSRAIDALSKFGLARRTKEGRQVLAYATPQGSCMVGRMMAEAIGR